MLRGWSATSRFSDLVKSMVQNYVKVGWHHFKQIVGSFHLNQPCRILYYIIYYNIYYITIWYIIFNILASFLLNLKKITKKLKCFETQCVSAFMGYILHTISYWIYTVLEAVSGNKKAKSGPFNKFRWIRNKAVTVLLGGAANKYIWNSKLWFNTFTNQQNESIQM